MFRCVFTMMIAMCTMAVATNQVRATTPEQQRQHDEVQRQRDQWGLTVAGAAYLPENDTNQEAAPEPVLNENECQLCHIAIDKQSPESKTLHCHARNQAEPNHTFHKRCIDDWLNRRVAYCRSNNCNDPKYNCPVCGTPVGDNDVIEALSNKHFQEPIQRNTCPVYRAPADDNDDDNDVIEALFNKHFQTK